MKSEQDGWRHKAVQRGNKGEGSISACDLGTANRGQRERWSHLANEICKGKRVCRGCFLMITLALLWFSSEECIASVIEKFRQNGDVAHLVKCFLECVKPQHLINWVWGRGISVILELGWQRQEDQQFKVILGYTSGLRQTWDTWDPISKQKKWKQTPRSKNTNKPKSHSPRDTLIVMYLQA